MGQIMDVHVLPFKIQSCFENGIVLKLEQAVHVVNWALENYAHSHPAVKHALNLIDCIRYGLFVYSPPKIRSSAGLICTGTDCYLIPFYMSFMNCLELTNQGLSTEVLKQLLAHYRITAGSHMTNKLRVEKLLKHLAYTEDQIAAILAKFPTRKSKNNTQDNDEEEDDDAEDQEITSELRSEAEILAHILDKLNAKDQKAKEAKMNMTPKDSQVNEDEKQDAENPGYLF